MKYAGADWLAEGKNPPMSEHGRAVADLLGQAFAGLYHLPYGTLQRIDWSHEWNIELVVRDGANWATFDGSMLTMLVVLAHDRCIRLEIGAARNGLLRLSFSKRVREHDTTYYRHPTLEDNVARIREAVAEPVPA